MIVADFRYIISLYLRYVKPNPQLMSMAKPIVKHLKTKQVMKTFFLTIIISLKSMMISAQNISSATVIYSGDLTTCRMYDIVPEMFDKGNYGEYVVTVKDTTEINELIKCAETLKLSKCNTLDTRGKIMINYDYKIPIKHLWIYWGQFDVCIGLNGLQYEISEQFARKLNQIMQKEANIVVFDSLWFEFLHKRNGE